MPNTVAIKARMKELGLTQAELASAVNIATPTMCQKINNIRPFTLEEAEKVAKRLELSDNDFGHYFFSN